MAIPGQFSGGTAIVDKSNIKGPVFIGVIVVVALVVGYFLWKGTAGAPEPTPGPGQTIQNPLGTASPGGRGGGPGGPGGMPAPGTAAPGRGMGPSRNAPIP